MLIITILMYFTVLLIGLWSWFQWRFRDLIRAASKIPAPTGYPRLPLIGHAYATVWSWEKVTSHVMKMITNSTQNGVTTVAVWIGPLPMICVSGLKDIQKILTGPKTTEKGDEMLYFNYAAPNNIFVAHNDLWRTTRRHFNPLFHPKNVEKLMPTFNKNCREMVHVLSEHVGSRPVDVLTFTKKIALKSVSHLMFGVNQEFDIDSSEFQGILHGVELAPRLFLKRILRLWLRIDAVFELLYKEELDGLKNVLERFMDLPLERARLSSAKKIVKVGSNMEDFEMSSKEPLNLLDVYKVMRETSPMFTEETMLSEIKALYLAGTDTTGSAVATSLLALAQYQDIQEKLYREIHSVTGDDEDDVTEQDLNRMPYLDQVYKETLRWGTIVPFILRKPSENLILSSCTIPTGSTIIVGLAGVHMDPNIYPEPMKFDPERFSGVNKTEKNTAFLPYSTGPRNCIGKKYSHMLMKLMLVHVVRKFKLYTDMDIHNLRKELIIVLQSKDGYNIRLQNR